MKSFAGVLVMFLFTCNVYGQGAYLERGQSGLGIGAGFSKSDDITGIGGNIGYSINGIFDIGLGVESFSYDEQFLGADMSATSISPSLTFYVLKQDDEMPLSFAIGTGYDWQMYSNDVLDNYDVKMTGGFISAGGSLFGTFNSSETFRIQPSIGFTYVTGKLTLSDNNGNEESDSDDTTVFGIGVGLAFNTTFKNVLVISPRVNVSEGTTSFGVGLSFIFGKN